MPPRFIAFAIFSLVIISCDTKEELIENNESNDNYYSDLEIIHIAPNNELIRNIELDTIIISHPEGIGKAFTKIVDGELIIFDILRAEVRKITKSFELGEYLLTKGDGPNEIPRINTFASNDTINILLASYTFFNFDKDWNYLNKGALSFYSNDELAEIEFNPKPEMVAIYEEKSYEQEPLFVNNKILIKIESSNPRYNFLMHKNYYKEARIATEVDYYTYEIESILGRRSPIYTNYNFIPHHDQHYWDIYKEGEIYVSFEPDSLIYICNDKLVPQKAFGVAGVNMLQDYREMRTVDEYYELWKSSISTAGYYKHLKIIEEDNLVFRTYNQGTSKSTLEYKDNPKRLQVYKDFELIADVSVPSFFKVIGKMGDYYYADGSAENRENEDIVLYRFKLNDQ